MSYWFSFVFPWLLVLWFLHSLASGLSSFLSKKASRGRRNACAITPDGSRDACRKTRWFAFLGFALAAVGVVLSPVGGIPLGRWLAGPNLHPSLPLLAHLVGLVWKAAFGRDLFRPQDREAAWVFGAVMGTVLYPLALGLGKFDPYSWGWSFSVLFPIIALTTIVLIWRGNRFGFLLILSILAYDLHLLESPNFWDYLVDPIYWLLSLGLLTKRIWSPANVR